MDKKARIIQVMPEFGLAGAEIMTENLSVSLEEDGYDISIVSLYDYHSAITERLENQNITIYYLGKHRGLDVKLIYKLYKLFKKIKPDIIHTHRYVMPYVIPAAILANIKGRIHTVHNIAKKEVGKKQRKIHHYLYKYCKVIPVSISPLVKKSLIEEYGFSDNGVPMVYNGIDLNKCTYKKDYKQKGGNINIIHIGRFSEQKNHIGLIESFKEVHDNNPNTILKLIGSGDLEEVVKDKVKELNLDYCVEFLGIKTDVYSYLYEADIFVLPSLWEGMPISLIEAMATGLPIVTTAVGGVPDMIENNVTGLLVDVNNKQIEEALLKLTYNCELREELGIAAKIASERYSAKEMESQYIKLYNSIINK